MQGASADKTDFGRGILLTIIHQETSIMKYPNMIRAFLLASAFLISAVVANGQSRVHFDVDYHYNLGLSQRIFHKNYGRGEYDMGGHSLHLTGRYDISERLSAGVGIGLDRYTSPENNTLPVFATFRYNVLRTVPQSYVFSDIGYGIGSSEIFTKGAMWNLGIGYTKMLARHFGLNFQVAYGLKGFRDTYSTVDDTNMTQTFQKSTSLRHSISFGVGLTF